MDLSFSEQDRAFQAEVRSFLKKLRQEIQDKKARSALASCRRMTLWVTAPAAKDGQLLTGQPNTVAPHSLQRKATSLMLSAPASVPPALCPLVSPWSLQ